MVEKIAPDPQFEALLRHIQESRGVDFRGYKRTSLQRRIAIRMEAVGTEDFAGYRSYLEAQPGESEDLLNTVLINVTSFFRDRDAWDVLKDQIVPNLIEASDDDRAIRVWSVGCASGEEPYSIAMLLAERLGVPEFCRRVKIYATDLDEEALKVARLAAYSPHAVEGVPPDLLEKYFERTNNHYVFERELRKSVIFGRHNIVRDAPISRIDLLICRNLLIYLEAETQAVVLPRLHYALNSAGYLFLGKAETQLARSALFRPVEMKHRIFEKVPQEWRRPLGGFATVRNSRLDPHLADLRLLETVINETGTALLVVDEQGILSLANATARRLLGVGEADVGRPFHDLPVSYRPTELRGPIDEVFAQRRSVRLEEQEYRPSQGEVIRLTVDIRPLQRTDGGIAAVLLAFTDHTHMHVLQRELEASQETLENTVEELQSANEELETTNEELQSTNEELETTNEELQSTNEELETLNEEARSSNEEMESVNEELRIQAEQAAGYRLHLESVLRTMNGGIVVLDQRHVIHSWNRWSETRWGLRADDVLGTSFDALEIGLPVQSLQDIMAAVLAGRADRDERVLEGLDRRGRRIICRVQVSGLLGENDEIEGLVLVFIDITQARAGEIHETYLGRVMDGAPNALFLFDPTSLRFLLANASARAALGYDNERLLQMALPDVTAGVSADGIHALVAPVIAGDERQAIVDLPIRTADGQERTLRLSLRYMAQEVPPILIATAEG